MDQHTINFLAKRTMPRSSAPGLVHCPRLAGSDKKEAKSSLPATAVGMLLQSEIQKSALQDDLKAKLIREIADYEDSHGKCTDTFCKKIRKQLRVT